MAAKVHQRARGEETMIMTMTTIVTVIGTKADKMTSEMTVMATEEVEAAMVDTISIDDDFTQCAFVGSFLTAGTIVLYRQQNIRSYM
mmetsp:Transcript_6015/g.16870  ORF Transcript_6015/g.16870 Transcript_6015/m.16870 type:complete len:87 (-) Transcript_6015:36-296(-)